MSGPTQREAQLRSPPAPSASTRDGATEGGTPAGPRAVDRLRAAEFADRMPLAARRPTAQTVHGVEIVDEFAWLRAPNWREVLRDGASALPDDIRAHLVAENSYCEAVLSDTRELQSLLVAEMRARITPDDVSAPTYDGDFAYYRRFAPGAERPLICRRPREAAAADGETSAPPADETVLLDVETLAKGKPFFDLGGADPSPDHTLLAWTADEAGSEYFTVRVRDIAGARDLDDVVPATTGQVVWRADGRAFYYVRADSNHRPRQVLRHVLGTASSEDVLIYDEPRAGWFVSIDETQSGDFLVVSIGDHDTSEARVLPLEGEAPELTLIHPRESGLRYEVDHDGSRFVIRTNAAGAVDFKLVEAPVGNPGRANWRDLTQARAGVMVTGFAPYADWLVRVEREDGLSRVVVRETATGAEHVVAFEEEIYALSFDGGRDFETDTIRLVYSSMSRPTETYDYDMRRRERRLVKRDRIPSGHDPELYEVRRLFATAPDGERVPISLVKLKSTPIDGSAPLMLYAYGAYGWALPASFSAQRLSLINRGFVSAIAHVRGGTEKGWNWYEAGRRERKANSFTDTVACARTLIEAGYTGPGRIVLQGRSAGGMLAGVVANLAPQLFAGISAEVPFVDVLQTMLDGELPLTPPEWPEWGNPIEDRAAFERMRSYSPVDNVGPRDYPAILAIGGLTDPRVTYWEPAKWIAKLRHEARSGVFLLRTFMEAGHAGATGRYERLDESALVFAFALRVTGTA